MLHTSMLGTFFVYTLAQSMPIFKKKSSQIFLGESCPRVYIMMNSYEDLEVISAKNNLEIILFWVGMSKICQILIKQLCSLL